MTKPSETSKTEKPKKTGKEPEVNITVFGGRKDDVTESLKKNLLRSEDVTVYQTWVNVRALKRMGFLFTGGVESAGGCFDVLFVIAVAALLLTFFVFWQIVIFFIVIGVLTLLSGGAAWKFVRGVFVEAPPDRIKMEGMDDFVREQLLAGRFVKVGLKNAGTDVELGSITKKSNQATKLFRDGIYLALAMATCFLIVEVGYWIYYRSILVPNLGFYELLLLASLGCLFLVGVIVMNAGVLARRRLAGRLAHT